MGDTPSRRRPALRTMGVLAIVLVLASALVLGLWFLARIALRAVSTLENEIAAAVVAASAAGVASVLTVVYSQRRSKERDIAEAHRPQKVSVYGGYMEMMFDVLRRIKAGDELTEETLPPELLEKMYLFRRELILWGSPGVIRAYLQWEATAVHSPTSQESILAWDALLRAFRQDLGNSNWLLKGGQLIHLILTPEAREKLGSAQDERSTA